MTTLFDRLASCLGLGLGKLNRLLRCFACVGLDADKLAVNLRAGIFDAHQFKLALLGDES